MANLLTPKRVCDILGISPSALRLYVDRYAQHLSDEAIKTPRKFNETDLRTLAFVVTNTKEGRTHEQVLQLLTDNKTAVAEFEWEPPTPALPGGTENSIVPVDQYLQTVVKLETTQARLEDLQRQKDEVAEHARQLQEQNSQLLRELGTKEGELSALKAQRRKPPAWWVRLFGGGE